MPPLWRSKQGTIPNSNYWCDPTLSFLAE